MHSDIGFLKINGLMLPIASMRLRRDQEGGGMKFVVNYHGKYHGSTGLVQLFDADGKAVIGEGMDKTGKPITIPEMRSNDHLQVTYNLNFGHTPITSRTIHKTTHGSPLLWENSSRPSTTIIPPPAQRAKGRHRKEKS